MAVLDVEIGGLGDFATFLDRELRANLDPTVDTIRTDSPHGLNWGVTLASALVGKVRSHYVDSQEEALRNLAAYLWAGRTMRELIDRLVDTYRSSEEMAQLTTEDVLALFTRIRVEGQVAAAHRVIEYLESPPAGGDGSPLR
jgi:hypothetical protein